MRWTRFALNHPTVARIVALSLTLQAISELNNFMLGWKWT